MSDGSKSYHDQQWAIYKDRILKLLKHYTPDLRNTTGALPVASVPILPGTKIEDGAITEAKLSFDPATQAELDAHAADTMGVHGIADTSLLLDTGDLTASHNHTGASADGGPLTNDAHDGYSLYAEIASPSTPAADTARLYAKDKSGVSALYYKDDAGVEHDLGGGAGAYAVTIGDGVATSYVITHSLGTRDVLIQVHEAASPYALIAATIEITSTSTVTVTFATAPSSNQYRVVVGLSAAGGSSGIDIDDGSTTVNSATALSFVGGTVVDLGGGAAEYTPPSGGGGTIHTSAYASPPGSPVDGDVWIPSDSPYTAYRTGSAWVWRYKGSPVTLPDIPSFAWVNQGTAVITNNGGSLNLAAPANGTSNFRIREVAKPAATYKLRVGLSKGNLNVNFASAGLCIRDSSGLRILTLAYYQVDGVMVQEYTGVTSGFSATIFGPIGGFLPDYLEIEEDATTRYFRIGRLGQTMATIYSHAVATWLTPTHVGIYVDSNNATYPAFIDVFDFQLT